MSEAPQNHVYKCQCKVKSKQFCNNAAGRILNVLCNWLLYSFTTRDVRHCIQDEWSKGDPLYRNSLTGDASFNYVAMRWNGINLWRRGYNWTKSMEYCTGKQTGYIILCSTKWVRLIYSLHLIILLFKTYCEKAIWADSGTVYPNKYAHGFCFAVLCCGYTLTDFPISIRLTSLALWQYYDCPSASKSTLMNMDKYFM